MTSPPPGAATVVLVGLSVREVEERHQLAEAAASTGAHVAFLQVGTPSLHMVLDSLADAPGAPTDVLLVGVSLGSLAPGVSWAGRVAAAWLDERSVRGLSAPVVHLAAPTLGPTPDTLERVLALVADGACRVVADDAGALDSPAWQEPPRHRHQLLVCRGPRCTARGSDRTAEAIVLAMVARGLEDDDVLLTHTACLSPCNRGPVVCVQPDDAWFGPVHPEDADDLVSSLRPGSRPEPARRSVRSPSPPPDPP
ncbi:(2Fe-2S) ferredoxin domain-containing protein [Nocardioides bruguierae]|uniref:(2Fe-2S) ferredoxin domain-containing protein n=1 Tax=Nocardioides bruguierae TaxID=2945102 RepID=UPI0020213730|nr:(2Fe-2S) ferredoxin domain-containing protein [Nocardioides bruguierae]MCL8026958.1 (2Fe-2S) ferredoxin domain-containing protein [Nocardioides bruguierae]